MLFRLLYTKPPKKKKKIQLNGDVVLFADFWQLMRRN